MSSQEELHDEKPPGPAFAWSEYTLPDNFRADPTDYEILNSPVSGNSATTDPFDVGSASVEAKLQEINLNSASYDTDSKNEETPEQEPEVEEQEEQLLNKSCSVGFEITELAEDIEGGSEKKEEKWAIPVKPQQADYHFNPDMGFFGVASPPTKVHEWMMRDLPSEYRIQELSSESSNELGISMSPRSIPNSPPQSPLYRRQAGRKNKIFEDINEYEVFRPEEFLVLRKCYDLIPMSGKLIVFDKKLVVRKAFNALILNGTRAAPIWDSSKQEYNGMLTITDFIRVLNYCYKGSSNPQDMEEVIETRTIEDWKKISEAGNAQNQLIAINPTETLLEAARVLLDNQIHRLPVIDPRSGNTLYILTHKRILNFIYPYILEAKLEPYFFKSIKELGIGTYDHVKQLKYDSTLAEAIEFFASTRVSAIPVVDDNREVVDIYARFDVITLATRRKYHDKDMTIRRCLQLRSSQSVKVHTCSKEDTLINVIKNIYNAQVHRLVIVDDQRHVIGLVSLSDLFKFLVSKPETPSDYDCINSQYFEFG